MASTQIRDTQILDGTIRNAEIAADAAIANSKLNLASIAQAITLSHIDGLRLDSTRAVLVLRDTDTNIQAGGLYRLIVDGGTLRLESNTAVAGDFSTFEQPIEIGGNGASVNLRGRLQLLDSVPNDAHIVFGNPAVAGPLADNALFRSSLDNRLHYKDNAALDQTLAYLSDITTVTTPDIHEGGVKITGLATPAAPTVTPQGTPGTTTWGYKVTAVGVNGETLGSVEGTTATGNAVLGVTNFNRITWAAVSEAKSYNVYRTTAGGTPATTGKIGNATQTTFDDTGLAATGSTPTADTSDTVLIEHKGPQLQWRDTNVALPLGLWRLRGLNDELRLDENLAAAGDFSTHEPRLRIAGNLTVAVHGRLRIENPLAGPSGAIAASIQWVDAVAPTNLVANSLFRSLADNRLHVKDNASVDQTLAYLNDIVSPGNTVLVSEYVTKEAPAGVVDGVNTAFTLAFTPEPGTEQVYLNGLLQSPGATEDYTISGATITFSSAPVAGDKIRVSYIKA